MVLALDSVSWVVNVFETITNKVVSGFSFLITSFRITSYNVCYTKLLRLKDFYKIINLNDDSDFEEHKGEAETIAGFILEISGTFPRRNSKINFKNYVFTIEAFDKKRIKQVVITSYSIHYTKLYETPKLDEISKLLNEL